MDPPPDEQLDFTMRFFEMRISGSLTSWLMGDVTEPPETIARWITTAIPDDIKWSIAPPGATRMQWLALP